VRVPGHEHVHLGLGALGRHGNQRLQLGRQLGAHRPQVQPQVGHHLVVARTAGVHLAACRADELRQAALVGGVDVLVALLDDEDALGPFLPHQLQAVADRARLGSSEHAAPLERSRVRHAAVDVVRPHHLVHVEAIVEALHHRVGLAREAAAPQLGHGGRAWQRSVGSGPTPGGRGRE
jgi:hypothetical protein